MQVLINMADIVGFIERKVPNRFSRPRRLPTLVDFGHEKHDNSLDVESIHKEIWSRGGKVSRFLRVIGQDNAMLISHLVKVRSPDLDKMGIAGINALIIKQFFFPIVCGKTVQRFSTITAATVPKSAQSAYHERAKNPARKSTGSR